MTKLAVVSPLCSLKAHSPHAHETCFGIGQGMIVCVCSPGCLSKYLAKNNGEQKIAKMGISRSWPTSRVLVEDPQRDYSACHRRSGTVMRRLHWLQTTRTGSASCHSYSGACWIGMAFSLPPKDGKDEARQVSMPEKSSFESKHSTPRRNMTASHSRS